MDTEYPVVIAGAGPVGLALAVELTRRGLACRIFDKGEGPTPVEQSRALAILPVTLAVLKASGIADRLLAEGQPIRRARILWRGKGAAVLDLRKAPTPTPFILSLPQGRTERAMIDWLTAHDVAIEWGVSVVDVGETHRPEAVLSTGERVRARAIAGCDGAHSSVRAALGIPFTGEAYEQDFALADVAFDPAPAPDEAVISVGGPGETSALLPFGNGRARLIGTLADPQALVAATPNIADIGWTSRFHVAFRHAERLANGMVFLAGDAAHIHSPVGGRGMNLGIWDAAWLAFLLSESRASEYEMRRLPSVRLVLKQTRAMTDMLAHPPAWIGPFLRYGLPVALRIPAVQHRIATRILALDLPQPEWLS